MNDKDEIKELFQKELGNYQAKVNPKLWEGIKSNIGNTVVTTATGTSVSLISKIIIGVGLSAIVTVGAILMFNQDKNPKTEKEIAPITQETKTKETQKEIEPINDSFADKSEEDISSSVLTKEKSLINSNYENNNVLTTDINNINIIETDKYLTNPTQDEENPTISEQETIYSPVIENVVDKNSESLLNKEEKSETFDLSKINIKTEKQNNQYIAFYAENVPENAEVHWDFGDNSFGSAIKTEHFYSEPNNYRVSLTVRIEGEEITKNIDVQISIQGEIGELPNIFTPNGDGRNDAFFIVTKHLKTFQLTVLDNNQNIVYSTNDPYFIWKGLDKNGNFVKDGSYIYIIVAEDEVGNIINKYQQLTIIR